MEQQIMAYVVYSSTTDFMRRQMDMAQMKVATGVTDYNTAIRDSCSALAASGLRTIYYQSGRSDRIEVAVRRALMTSVSQVAQRISEQNAEQFGADGWEISAHSGARPSHAVYQGRQFPNSQYETIVKPLIEDYNCRHSAYPIIMGLNKPTYTEEQLQNIDPPPITYEGKRYTAYEATQQMRKMERIMRKQKDLCITADAAGDSDLFTAASIKLRRQKDIYEDFAQSAGMYTEYERATVSGYNRHLAGKTGAVTRQQRAFDNAQMHLTDGGNGDIIKETENKPISTVANFDIINSDEYKSKFNGVFNKQKACTAVCKQARSTIRKNSGTTNESFSCVNSNGDELCSGHTGAFGGVIDLSALEDCKENSVILIHNHPTGSSFSSDDISTLLSFKQIKTIIAAGHNGKVYSLSIGKGSRNVENIFHEFNVLKD